ncbi:hypothetical protein INT48_000198 [Thamnidium elegans]|uniref:F-box domain-containing protein n=1 Tax=Thamnidium elegans TaxID=101142 RepID=A0A8H7SY99_9FUNG|nr:hypothetical protein INT48_000198 [Thamnidium elegans]
MTSYNLRSWSELPAEILQHTLRKVDDKKTIFQCQLVCKTWQKSAERIGYHTIDFTSYDSQLKKFVDTLQSSEHLGKLVNRFNFNKIFHNPDKPWDPKGHFDKLSDHCPNVQVITTGHACYSLWLRLLTEKDKWKKLLEIPKPFQSNDIQVYMATAFAFNDRLTHLILALKSPESRTVALTRGLRVKLLSDLSTFKSLKHLGIHRPNGMKLEEVDEILDTCPQLASLTIPLLYENTETAQDPLETIAIHSVARRSAELLDKIKLLKPKTSLKKLNFNVTTDGGDETLTYIMHVMPNLDLLQFNQDISISDEKRNIVYSVPVISSFLQYGLHRKFFAVKYLGCEDISSVLSVYWRSEAYRATKKEISLSIDGNGFLGNSFPAKPSISISGRRDVTVSYTSLEGTSTPVELIERMGPVLINLNVKLSPPVAPSETEETIAIYQGYFLDHVFERCRSLKKLECSFPTLQSCNPELSTNASIEELDLNFTGINPTVLYQLSVRLPNLKIMTFIENTFIKYDGRPIKGRKMTINMPYTKFDKLCIEETPKKDYAHFFLKFSNENGDQYFYSALKPGMTKLEKCVKILAT